MDHHYKNLSMDVLKILFDNLKRQIPFLNNERKYNFLQLIKYQRQFTIYNNSFFPNPHQINSETRTKVVLILVSQSCN